jgi:hypothetical protein
MDTKKLDKLLYSTREAQLTIGCGPTRLWQRLANGKLPVRRLGRRTMIEAQSLHALVSRCPGSLTPTMQRQAASTETKPAV